MQRFENPVWEIPVCSAFQFNTRHKHLLCKYFTEVEETGENMCPQQV